MRGTGQKQERAVAPTRRLPASRHWRRAFPSRTAVGCFRLRGWVIWLRGATELGRRAASTLLGGGIHSAPGGPGEIGPGWRKAARVPPPGLAHSPLRKDTPARSPDSRGTHRAVRAGLDRRRRSRLVRARASGRCGPSGYGPRLLWSGRWDKQGGRSRNGHMGPMPSIRCDRFRPAYCQREWPFYSAPSSATFRHWPGSNVPRSRPTMAPTPSR
jgi:hypothetical protein